MKPTLGVHIARSTLAVACLGGLIAPVAQAGLLTGQGQAASFEGANGLYGGVAVGVLKFRAPERENVGAIYEEDGTIQLIDIHSFEAEDTAPLLALQIGKILSAESAFGRNLRVEGGISYFSAEDTKRVSRDNGSSGYWTDFLALDGTGFVVDLASGNVVSSSFKSEYDYYDVDLRLKSDLVISEQLVVSPSVGLAIARLDEDHKIRFRDVTSGEDFNHIDEEVESWYVGPVVGADIAYQATSNLTLTGGVNLQLAYSHSEYDGHQNYLAVAGSSSVDDTDINWGYRSTVSVGAVYAWDKVSLGITAGLDYWSDAPVIEHPSAIVGVGYSDIDQTSPAGLDSESMLNSFVTLSAGMSF